MADARALAADLLLRLGVDASGVAAELSSKLTAAERAAVSSGDRIAAGVAKGADKATVAQLRVVAATEKYNRVLQDETATVGQKASAQAALITSQQRLNRQQVATAAGLRENTAAARNFALATAAIGTAAAAYVVTSVGKFRDLAGEVRGLVRLTGQSAESASQLRFAAQQSGVGIDVLSGGLRAFEKHLASNDKAAQSLGFAYRDTAGRLLPFDQILARVQERFRTLPDGPEKTALALQLFGRQGATLLPLLSRSSDEMETLAERARRLGLVLSGDSLAQVKRAAQAQKDLSSAVESLQVSMGQRSLPVITKFKEILAGGLTFAAEHEKVAATSAAVVGLGAAFGKAGSFASNFNEVTAAGGQLLALIRARSAGTVAANSATTASYVRLTAAANAANAAEARGAAGLLGGKRKALAAGAALAGAGVLAADSGNGAVSGLSTVGGAALLGAGIGSFVPGIGTGVGAAVGGAIGVGGLIFGARDPDGTKTTRSVAQVSRELAAVTAQVNAAPDRVQIPDLIRRQIHLKDELKAAERQAKATTPVFNELTGAYENLTSAQVKAKLTTAQHEEEMRKLREQVTSLAASPVAGQAGIASARKALADAKDARDRAAEAVREARGARVGGPGATGTDFRVAELRLQTARERLAKGTATPSERAAVLTAQQRLNELRNKGRATAEQTEAAENRIRDAIDSQRDAQQRVNEARKALSGAQGLSAAEALERVRAQIRAQGNRGADAATLIRKGITGDALEAIEALDAQSPGSLHKIAQTRGKKFVQDYNAGIESLTRQTSIVNTLLKGSEIEANRRGIRIGEAFLKGWREVLSGEGPSAFNTSALTPRLPQPPVRNLPNKVLAQGFLVP